MIAVFGEGPVPQHDLLQPPLHVHCVAGQHGETPSHLHPGILPFHHQLAVPDSFAGVAGSGYYYDHGTFLTHIVQC